MGLARRIESAFRAGFRSRIAELGHILPEDLLSPDFVVKVSEGKGAAGNFWLRMISEGETYNSGWDTITMSTCWKVMATRSTDAGYPKGLTGSGRSSNSSLLISTNPPR